MKPALSIFERDVHSSRYKDMRSRFKILHKNVCLSAQCIFSAVWFFQKLLTLFIELLISKFSKGFWHMREHLFNNHVCCFHQTISWLCWHIYAFKGTEPTVTRSRRTRGVNRYSFGDIHECFVVSKVIRSEQVWLSIKRGDKRLKKAFPGPQRSTQPLCLLRVHVPLTNLPLLHRPGIPRKLRQELLKENFLEKARNCVRKKLVTSPLCLRPGKLYYTF